MTNFQIECFMELARCGNFTRASENLFVSQPTLSRNIALLEEELGLTLFIRQKHQLTELTPEGQCLLAGFQPALRSIQKAVEDARQIADGLIYTLRLGMLEGQLVDNKLCEILNLFLKDNKNVRLEIIRESFHSLVKKLMLDKVDVIVTLEWELANRSGLNALPLYRLPTVLVAPKDLVEQMLEGPHSLADFSEYPFICVEKEDSCALTNLLINTCQRVGFHPKIQYVSDMNSQMTMLEMGNGVAGLNPYHAVCYSPNVRCVEIKEFEPQLFFMACKKNGKSEISSIFEEWCRKHQNFREETSGSAQDFV